MELLAMTVFDSKTEAYLRPFYCTTVNEGLRMFIDTLNDPNTMINKHPEDYALYHIGIYDDGLGVFENIDHVALGLASNFITEEN